MDEDNEAIKQMCGHQAQKWDPMVESILVAFHRKWKQVVGFVIVKKGLRNVGL